MRGHHFPVASLSSIAGKLIHTFIEPLHLLIIPITLVAARASNLGATKEVLFVAVLVLLVMDGAHTITILDGLLLATGNRTKLPLLFQFLLMMRTAVLPKPPLFQLVASLTFARFHIRLGDFQTGLDPVLIEMFSALTGTSALALTGTSWRGAARIFVFPRSLFGRCLGH